MPLSGKGFHAQLATTLAVMTARKSRPTARGPTADQIDIDRRRTSSGAGETLGMRNNMVRSQRHVSGGQRPAAGTRLPVGGHRDGVRMAG